MVARGRTGDSLRAPCRTTRIGTRGSRRSWAAARTGCAACATHARTLRARLAPGRTYVTTATDRVTQKIRAAKRAAERGFIKLSGIENFFDLL